MRIPGITAPPQIIGPRYRIRGDVKYDVGPVDEIRVGEQLFEFPLVEASQRQIEVEPLQVFEFGTQEFQIAVRIGRVTARRVV